MKKKISSTPLLITNSIFCKKTLVSNQRPNSEIEFKHNIKTKRQCLYLKVDYLSGFTLEKNTLIGKIEANF